MRREKAAREKNKLERGMAFLNAAFRRDFCDCNFPITSPGNSVRRVALLLQTSQASQSDFSVNSPREAPNKLIYVRELKSVARAPKGNDKKRRFPRDPVLIILSSARQKTSRPSDI